MSEYSPISHNRGGTHFISKADTAEMREYQRTASKYPPLRHNELLMFSRLFQKGRNAEVMLDERKMVLAIVGDELNDANLEEKKSEIISAYASHIVWISGKKKPAALLAIFAGNDTPEQIYERRFDNILASPAYSGNATIAEMYPPSKDMSVVEFVENIDKIRTACRSALEDKIPQDIPKDVIDRWKQRADELSDDYMGTVKQLDMTPRQIRRLEHQIEEGKEALNVMVNHNLQLAMFRVSKMLKSHSYARENVGVLDLIGAANIGLLLGARQFDPEKKKRFSTYAAYHIDAQLYDILQKEDGIVGIQGMTHHEKKQHTNIKSVQKSFMKIYGREATMSELQSLTGISSVIIKKRLSTPQLVCESYNAPIKKNDGEENIRLEETIASEKTIEHEMAQTDMQNMITVLREEIVNLPHISRAVIEGKTGITSDPQVEAHVKSIKQIASECGISPHEVSVKYSEAMEMLKRRLIARGFSADALPFL